MKLMSTYAVKISRSANLRSTLSATAGIYRKAVDFFIGVCMEEWLQVTAGNSLNEKKSIIEIERRKTVTREEYIEKREMERRQLRRSIAKKNREWQVKKEIVNAAIAGMITFLSIIYGILYL